MPFQLTPPLEQEFILVETDEFFKNSGEPTTVSIKQATQGEAEARAALFANITQIINNKTSDNPDEIKLSQSWSLEALKRKEVFLTLVACNISTPEGKQLFRFRTSGVHGLGMTEFEFAQAWNRLPPLVANEIHEKVLEINKDWRGTEGS